MKGTDFNKTLSIFTIGYIVGMIPNNLMLQIVPPRIWLPLMQVVWGILTFSTSAVQNVQQLFVIRFLQGMAESSTFVGSHYILGSWYKPRELGVRSAVFTSSGLVGTLCSASGDLQAVVDGVGYGVITLPIALYGLFLFPDLPATTKAFYLTEQERLLASERLQDDIQVTRTPLSMNVAKRVLSKWRWYACSLLFAISGETESFGSNNLMGQWLKAIGGYTVEQIDYYPSGVTAFAIVSTLVCAIWTDKNNKRWAVLVYMSIACIVASICLLDWSSPTGLKFFAYCE
ncbi:hypothetical protein D9758_001191 [Tetrapyrgos nigripes]|uniref:Uncharacterized protein n=1 Tax=Tetrapyrgos nigripes TaxID=182062 RepID=A0A8H5GRV9_9AGAR|nr:hypothetical protein D9758_001191 [Tetrapyrgos nigripes]